MLTSEQYQDLIKCFEHDDKRAARMLREQFSLRDGARRRPEDFDLGKLFTECFGWNAFESCRSDRSNLATKVMEAAGAVATNAFQHISGQILFSATMEAFQSEDFKFTPLIPTRPTQFLKGEMVPGITRLGDESTVVNEGDAYPLAGVGEDYIQTPKLVKRGVICPVTREALFGDRTGELIERTRDLAYGQGLNKEKRAIDCIVDENTTAHRYKWRGTVIATYNDNTGTHSWDNLAASNTLTDHTAIDTVEQLFANMLDPNTGEPIMVMATDLIVTPQLTGTAWRVLNSLMVSLQAGGFATTGNLYRTDSLSPVGRSEFSAPYKLLSSRMLPTRMATDTTWYLGNVGKAFRYMEGWPMQTFQSPPNSYEEWHRDIVQQTKINELGAYATFEPRYMVKSTV